MRAFESRWHRLVSVALILALIKGVVLLSRWVDGDAAGMLSPWTPLAFLYQDALVLLCFGVVDLLGTSWCAWRGSSGLWWGRFLWGFWAAAIVYTAFTIPIVRVFSTPLTYPMLSAAGGALADSFLMYVTLTNTLSVAVILTGAWTLPRRIPTPPPMALRAGVLGVWAVVLVWGSGAVRKVESLGLHRNALMAMATTAWDQLQNPSSTRSALPALPPTPGKAVDLRKLAGKASGYHVIWLNLESHGARYLKPYGAKREPMPHVAGLLRQALIFDAAYAAYPSSIKGLHSMLCSTYTASHTKARHYRGDRLPCTSISQRLRDAGYRTAMFHSGWFYYFGMDHVVSRRGFHTLEDAGKLKSPFRTSFGVDEPTTVKRCLQWIDAGQKQQPFFLMYLPIAGHHPYRSPGKGPRPFPAKTMREHYLNDIYMGDDAIGALIRGLKDRKLLDKTLWVIMGDHGQAFFQHKGNFVHSLFIYEENVRVPLYIVLPKVLSQPRRVPQLASLIDVAPTLLSLLGLRVPKHYQGRSLLEPKPGVVRFLADQTLWQLGLRQGPWKFIYQPDTDRSKLFDLRKDPGEKRNLAGRYEARSQRYKEHLLAWSRRQRSRVLKAKAPKTAPKKGRRP